MNKLKTTRKAVVEAISPAMLKSCGYCELQNLLHNHSPIAYTIGVYGWNFDVYDVYGLTICTGYRGMPGKDDDLFNWCFADKFGEDSTPISFGGEQLTAEQVYEKLTSK